MPNILNDLNKPLELIAPLPLEAEFDQFLVTQVAECNVGVVCQTGKFN
jgi:hypothetical protein